MTSTDGPSLDPSAATVTRLLNEAAAAGGEQAAAAATALLPLVYDQLRRLAGSKMRQQPPEHTLQATALAHEAYLRLGGGGRVRGWEGRRHFFAAAAEAMRCILVDAARRRKRLKRGGGRQRVDLDAAQPTVNEPPEDL